MNMYQVSYNVKDSKKTDGTVVLEDLVRILKTELMASKIIRPVASTLRFEGVIERSAVWGKLANWAKKHGIWYMASEIVESEDGKHWRYNESEDVSLQTEVDEMIKRIHEAH